MDTNMDDDVVRSWKEYTPAKGRSANPAESIEVDSRAFGGLFSTAAWICCGSYELTHNTQVAE